MPLAAEDAQARSAVLKKVEVFSHFSEAEIRALAGATIERELLTGEFLFRRGDVPNKLYVLVEGVAKSVVYSRSGKALTLAVFAPNNVIGEAAFLTGSRYASSCLAVSDVRVLAIPSRAFAPFVSNHPEISTAAVEILVRRLLQLQSRLENLAGPSVEQRVISVLLYLQDKLGTPFAITKGDIGEIAGLTTETVIRAMSSLEKRNLLSSRRGRVTFLDTEQLERLRDG